MCEQVLFHEYVGGGDDTDGGRGNGIVVTLGRWNTENFRLYSHYTITARVMIEREIIVDEISVFVSYTCRGDAEMIRKAIARMDQLKEKYPECEKLEES